MKEMGNSHIFSDDDKTENCRRTKRYDKSPRVSVGNFQLGMSLYLSLISSDADSLSIFSHFFGCLLSFWFFASIPTANVSCQNLDIFPLETFCRSRLVADVYFQVWHGFGPLSSRLSTNAFPFDLASIDNLNFSNSNFHQFLEFVKVSARKFAKICLLSQC